MNKYWDESDEEYDARWARYSFEARENLTPQFINSLAERDREELEAMNQEVRVFDQPVGGQQNFWTLFHGFMIPSLDFNEGWREEEDGTRVQVTYYWLEGWFTSDELFRERQLFPRTAP